jgi:hypothetical protein
LIHINLAEEQGRKYAGVLVFHYLTLIFPYFPQFANFFKCGAGSNCLAPVLRVSVVTHVDYLFLAQMNISKLTPNDNAEGNDVGGIPLITMIDLNSLTLPLFTSDEGLQASSPLCQMDKFKPSAPILMSQSSTSNPISTKVSAALVLTARSYFTGIGIELTSLPENSEQRHTAENVPSQAVQLTKLDFITSNRHILFATIWRATTVVELIIMVHHYVLLGPANTLS